MQGRGKADLLSPKTFIRAWIIERILHEYYLRYYDYLWAFEMLPMIADFLRNEDTFDKS